MIPFSSVLSVVVFIPFVGAEHHRQQNVSPIRNVRAHYDAKTDMILVDWEWSEIKRKELEDYKLFVRYKVSNLEWRRVESDEDSLGAKIPLGQVLNNGDEFTIQVIAESNEREFGVEQSDLLVIWVARRTDRGNESGENSEQKRRENAENGNGAASEEELLPPYNFTANVLGPGQVRLEWRQPPLPFPSMVPFYIVNARQLSANTGDRFPPQQDYEFTIRTALDAERISSAAAIVEIAIPLESDLVEVGKLIVTSRFRPDGHGVVNLTWEVPQYLRRKILSYEMRYTEADRARSVKLPFWEQLVFPGTAPTGEIHDMKSDSEYVLRIRTTMTSGAQVESGEFRIRTPKSAGTNPIARLDVLYSSETPSVRLQWILAPHINIALVGGYDVFVTDRYDLPEREWSHRRVHGSEPQMTLDSLSPSTTYFVRIDVRNSDGTDVKSQAAYRFTTFETLPLQSQRDFRHADTLAFQQIGHGRVKVQWEMPEAVKLVSKGISIFYNSDTREPLDRWHRMDLDSSEPRSIELIGLRANADYNVHIVPLGMDGRPMWTHTQRLQLRTKAEDDEATKLARPMAKCAIKQNEKNENCWKVEMSRNGGKKWQMEVEQEQEQKQDDAFPPFWHFELATIALSGPFIGNGISLLNRRLRCNRQNRIRNVFVENFEFVDVQSTQTLFGQLIRQKCQRLHLKNCRFNTHFMDHSLLPEQSLNSLDFSLAQFKLEAENFECFPKNFVLWTMAKMAGDVRHRIRRPRSSPLLWDSIVPLESANERSEEYAQNLSTKFLFSLAAFVLVSESWNEILKFVPQNWQNVPMPPSFHIRLQRCPRNFSTTFGAFCDRLGISQMNLVFPSLSHRTAHIQGKQNQNVSPIRNVRAHYDAKTDMILVDWEWSEIKRKELEDYKLFVRYKVSNLEWRRVESDEDSLGAKISLGQVIAESNEREFGVEQSDLLVIWVARRTDRGNESGENSEQKRRENAENGNGAASEEELLPPYNFTANVLGPGQVRLEWRQPPLPFPSMVPFYIVNARQLSANTGDRFPPQQNYEFTIRTALDAERISSAAAIVEIAIPLESDLVEVGKLIVTSRFRPDGHGVVNLTWEVPQQLRGKILSYEMRYTEADRARSVKLPFWEQLVFPGTAPTGEIHDMKSDSEYVLRIRTTMTSGAQVESGEFRIRTPKSAGTNPIARLDVLYSSETPSVRLQWILAPHINIALVGGYDVFVTDRYDLPEREWSHRRVHGSEPQMTLDSLSPSTTYFVRIDVRNSDGTDVKSQAAYRFTTFETLPLQSQRDFRHADTLAFQQIGHGRVKVQWEMPEAVKLVSKGISIFYNSDTREPLDRWHRMDLDSSEPRSIELIGLRANADYNVHIVPLGMDGRPMWTHTQRLQLRTKAEDDEGEEEEERMRQNEKNENCWKVEMSRNGGKKWQMEVEQEQEQKQDDAFPPFWHFELATIALSGPFIGNGISLLNRRLRCNRQNRIRNVFVENFEFVDVQSTQTLFGQLIRQKCQRLHLKNCRFNTHFMDHSLLPEQSLNSLDFSLAQFKLEAENFECFPKNFVLWTMAKMAGDVRHRIRRPRSSPLLWDSIVPLESANERSEEYAQNLSTKFLFSLAAFVLNWQNVPMPPSFHIRLQRCPRNFSTTFGAFCDRLGISQMNLVFPSLSHRTAHIQGKQNQEKGFFELFSLKDVPSSPIVFCLVSQRTNEYF
ncbi:hypothetical protein GPALN_009675 [Globodera pallida]|nr:hypothetical protein GPALN_009675 [Globodera pallida]